MAAFAQHLHASKQIRANFKQQKTECSENAAHCSDQAQLIYQHLQPQNTMIIFSLLFTLPIQLPFILYNFFAVDNIMMHEHQ